MAIAARGLFAQRGRFRLEVDIFNADASGTALLGRNGAGKSTLLLVLQGLIAHEGTVARPTRCAGVFAQPAVLYGSVLWNVAAIARAVIGLNEQAAEERAKSVLSSVDLIGAMKLDARRLSSGQRQRLALARALILEPLALFLDEPFANVDADGRVALRKLVHEYVARSGCTLIVATQNLADVTALCRKAMVLDDGRPAEKLDVSDIGASHNPYVRALVLESQIVQSA